MERVFFVICILNFANDDHGKMELLVKSLTLYATLTQIQNAHFPLFII